MGFQFLYAVKAMPNRSSGLLLKYCGDTLKVGIVVKKIVQQKQL